MLSVKTNHHQLMQ